MHPAACLLAALLLLHTVAPAAQRGPNIILVMTDDQGYGDLSCHGNPILRTPHLDRFHGESVRFTRFHVSPTCAPTRSALLTGRHEFRNGVTHTIHERERMTLDAVTLPEVLRRAGYATGIFGKWHLGDEAERRPDRRGFDETFIHGGGGIGQSYPGSCGDAPGNRYFDPAILHNGRFVRTQGYCTDVFFSRAIEWMDEKLDAGTPFFAMITPNAPHDPLDVPEEYESRYAGKVPGKVAKFFGMIANFDDNFGRLLRKLEEWGIDRNTLVVFMTDNGSANGWQTFNAGMRAGKGTPWEGGTRVPGLWRWPAVSKGGVDVPALTAHLDVFPTLAEAAGATLDEKARAQIEGRSLLPLLRDASAPWPERTLFTHVGRWPKGADANQYKHNNCAIRRGTWTLVNTGPVNKPAPKRWQLFDLASDPGQQRDVAAQHPEIVAQLEAAYDEWWASVLPATLENERYSGPAENPFKVLFRQQFDAAAPAHSLP
jgi:arylsulfatase A-like enzyme